MLQAEGSMAELIYIYNKHKYICVLLSVFLDCMNSQIMPIIRARHIKFGMMFAVYQLQIKVTLKFECHAHHIRKSMT